MSEIYVYGPNDDSNDYSTMGLVGALLPTECKFREAANGDSSITLVHPLDPFGRYLNLEKGNILSVPVPVRTTPEIQNGSCVTTVWTYKVKPLEQLTSKYQRTLYKRKSGSSRLKIMKPGDILTIVLRPDDSGDDGKRWKAKTEYGTGWINPDGIELVTQHLIPDNSGGIMEIRSPWKVTNQLFRIYESQKTLDKITVQARHISYDLLYNMTRYSSEEAVLLQDAIDGVLNNCYAEHGFNGYTNVVNEQPGLFYKRKNPIEAFLNPEEGICKRFNVGLVRDNYDLYFLHDPGTNRGIRVQYRKNMTGVNFTSSDDEVVTRIIPIGETKDGSDLFLTDDDDPTGHYIDSPNISAYPIVHVHELKCENCKVNDKEDEGGKITPEIARARMREQAQELLDAKCDQPTIDMGVEFVNLGDTEEYKHLKDLENCFLYDYIIVQHPDLAIDVTAQIMEIEWDCLIERMIGVQIGSVGKTLANMGITTWQIPTGFSGSKIAGGTVGNAALQSDIISVRHMQSDSVNTDALMAKSVSAEKIDTDSLFADEVYADKLYAKVGEFVKIVAGNIEADKIDVDELTANIVKSVQVSALMADFDKATVKNLVAQALFLEYGNGDEVHIKNLSVDYAQMVGATIGKLCIKSSDGKYYNIDVNADGSVTATDVTKEIGDTGVNGALTPDGKRVIVETSMTVDDLNAGTFQAIYALINKLDAAMIDTDELIAREAFIQKLVTAEINSSGDTIELIAKKAAQGNVYTGDNPPANPVEGQLWVDTGVDPTVMRSWMGYDIPTDREIPSGELTADVVKFYPQTIRGDVEFVSEVECWQEGEGDPYVGGYGKNLLPVYEIAAITANGITYQDGVYCERNADGSIHVYGTALELDNKFYFVNPKQRCKFSTGTYTMSLGTDVPMPSGMRVSFEYYNSTGNTWLGNYGRLDASNPTRTAEISEENSLSLYIFVAVGQTVDVTLYPQLELGSEATDYVPYENIRPIHGRTDTSITLRGKNICPGVENGIAYANASGNDYVSASYCRTKKIPVEEGVIYTESISYNVAEKYRTYHFWDADGNWLGYSGYSLNNRPAGAAMMGISYYHQDTSKIIEWVQVEIGSVATDYEPYHGTTKTCAFDSILYGKNLLKQRQFASLTSNGISFVQQADGGIMVYGTASADASCNLSFIEDSTSATFSYPNRTLTASATKKIDTLAIKITQQPVNQTVVENGMAVFTVVAEGEGLSYQWEHKTPTGTKWITTTAGTGVTTNELGIEGKAYRDGYIYHCVITDANGNSVTSESAKLTIAPIAITQQPSDQTAAEGNTVVFTVVAEGEGLSYQWEHKTPTGTKWNTTTAGTGVTTNELGIEALAYRDGYIYHCVITDTNGNSITSESAKLTIAPIVISQQPSDQTAAEGNTVVFTVTAEGKSLTYQWQWRANSTANWGNTTVTGNQTNSITVDATTGRNGYQYRCLIKDANSNTKLSNAVTLIVESQTNPIMITSQPTSVTAALGSKAVFMVTAEGEGLTYQWEWRANSDTDWSNTTVTGNQTNSITVDATTGRNGYQYRCLIKDANGYGKLSNAVTLIVESQASETLVVAFGGWDESGATVSKGTVSDGGSLTFEGNGELARIYLMVYSGATVSTVIYPKLEIGSEATSYEPYDEYYGSFNSTIYGGSYDWKTGVLTVTHKLLVFDGSKDENWFSLNGAYNAYAPVYNIAEVSDTLISNRFVNAPDIGVNYLSANQMRQGGIYTNLVFGNPNNISTEEWCASLSLNPIEVVYELAEPYTIQYDPQEIEIPDVEEVIVFSSSGGTSVLAKISGWDTITADTVALEEKMAEAVLDINSDIGNLQSQIDGNITTWFYKYPPTLENEPASKWTDDAAKNNHLGDLFYDETTGYCYRFQLSDGVYGWKMIQDTDIAKALANAKNAQDTADNKRRVFYDTPPELPTPPYDVGDLWVQGSNGDILRCSVARTGDETGLLGDWVNASKYTDDTVANETKDQLKLRVSGVDIEYAKNQDPDNHPAENSAAWSTTVPTWQSGYYIWSRTVYVRGTAENPEKVYSGYTCLTTATSKSIKNIQEEFYVSTSKTEPIDGAWTTVSPSWSAGTYLWIRFVITYDDDTSVRKDPFLDETWSAAERTMEIASAARDQADAALKAARDAVTLPDFERVIRVKPDGLHVGDNKTSSEVLIDSASVNVVVNGVTYSTFGPGFLQLGDDIRVRRPTVGGIAFSPIIKESGS